MREGRTAFFGRVGPELYRENPFRVTGLPVDATTGDIRRRQREFEVKARLGANPGSGSPLLPLDPPPDLDSAQEAVQRLRDPLRRLEDELFWFWSSHNSAAVNVQDEALEALRDGRIDEAEQIWADPGPGRATAVAAHNLAVLAHARALDGSVADASTRDLWTQALEHWRTTMADDTFWDLVSARARQAGDPRLGADSAGELRESLPAALLSIGARLAVRNARDGDHDDARWLAELLRGSGLGEGAADTALRDAAGPDAAQLRSTGQAALDRVVVEPSRGLEEAVALLDLADPALAALEAVLSGQDSLVRGVRDEVASAVMRCVVQYVNETDDWIDATAPLERALSIAATETNRAQVQKNLDTVRENRVYGTCWFCKELPAHADWSFEQKMYGDVQKEHLGYQIRTTWQKVTISVPRCVNCAVAHKGRTRNMWAIGCVGSSAVFGAAVAMLTSGAVIAGIVVIVAAVLTLIVVAALAWGNNGLPGEAFQSLLEFPPIGRQLDAGWHYGDRPPDAGN